MSAIASPHLLTVAEIATALRVHPETIRRRIADGTIRAVAIGRVLRIPTTELERLLTERQP
jgi:excisionase family DNA binding protein